MSDQTPDVPQTIHIWMFAAATISTILVVPHAIVTFVWHLPTAIANLHMIITLGLWLAGTVFVTRQPSQHHDEPHHKQKPVDLQHRAAVSARDSFATIDNLEWRLQQNDE